MEQADNLQNNVDENNVDELDNSPLLSEVLGNALDKCKMFHVKLKEEGLVRGLVGPRDMNILWDCLLYTSDAADE